MADRPDLAAALADPSGARREWAMTEAEREQTQTERERAWRAGRRAERRIMDLAWQIADVGYTALARQRHPDVGGSHAAMIELGLARDLLHKRLPEVIRRKHEAMLRAARKARTRVVTTGA